MSEEMPVLLEESPGGAIMSSMSSESLPKGYKNTKIGLIPEEWDVAQVKTIARTYSGGTPSKSHPEYYGGVIPWVKSGELNGGVVNQTEEYITEDGLRNSSAKWVPADSILVAMYGATAGKVARLTIPATINQAVLAVIPHEEEDVGYVLYSLTKALEKTLYSHSQGSGQPNLNGDIIKNIMIPFPPPTERYGISTILSTIDEAIATTDAIIARNETVKQGLSQQLLTRGIDAEGRIRSEETHDFRDTPLGRLPAEWDVDRLENVTDVCLSSVDKKIKTGETPVRLCNYLDVLNNDRITARMEFMEATATESEIEKFSLRVNDVIITKDSETREEIAIPTVVVDKIEGLLCGYHLAILRPDGKILDGGFLSLAMSSLRINSQFVRRANGVTRYGLTLDTIRQAFVCIPSLNEQHQITQIIFCIEDQLQLERAHRAHLVTLKQGLMQDLLSGQVRVPGVGGDASVA